MKKPKYTLLVLTDLSDASNVALENAVNLSKIIDGSIHIFHVLKPSDVSDYENQYLAMRFIDKERAQKKARLKNLARKISKKEGISINTSCILGKLKEETLACMKALKPDIVVLGKRSKKWVNFLGDSFTKFILDTFDGSVLISGKEKVLQPSEIVSLGMFNTTTDELPVGITSDLRKYSKNPIKRFFIRYEKEQSMRKAAASNVITYEFESGNNTMNNIAKYVAKNNIGLLCINPNQRKSKGRLRNLKYNIKEAIQKINVPILIVNNKSSIQLQ